MTFYLKTYPDALRQLFVTTTIEETNAAFQHALVSLQKSFSLPGYRKGKVPTDIIKKANPPELIRIVSDSFMKEALEYLKLQNIVLYGQPKFTPINGLAMHQSFMFSLVCEVYPTVISAPDIMQEEFSYTSCIIDEPFVEMLLCKQIQLFESVTGIIKEFDLVKVVILNDDYTGDKPEALFDTLKLSMLIGKNIDDQITINFNDLNGYLPEFLGKLSDPLVVKITDISRAKEWSTVTDEEIAEKTHHKTKQAYREDSQHQFDQIVKQYNDAQKAEVLSSSVGSRISVEIPKSLWLNNLKALTMKTAEQNIVQKDISLNNISTNSEFLSNFSKIPTEALDGLAFILWLEEKAKTDNITIEDQELQYYFYQYAQNHQLPMKDYMKHLKSSEKHAIHAEAIRDKVLSKLVNTLSFKEIENIPLSEVLKHSLS